MKKILFLSPLPPPDYGSAISSKMCLQVLEDQPSYRVRNIRLNRSKEMSDLGAVSLNKVFGFLAVHWGVFKNIIVQSPDLVYVMPATGGLGFVRDFLAILIAKAMRKNLLIHLRTSISDRDNRSLVKRTVFGWAFRGSKVIVLASNLADGISMYVNDRDVSVLHNAISPTLSDSAYSRIREEKSGCDHLRLLFLSNMIKSKGWPVALEVARFLKQDGIPFSMRFAGNWLSDEDHREFDELVRRLGLSEHVSHVGHADDELRHSLLSTSDLLVFPTTYRLEALPRVIIEAMEYGVPAVTTTHAGIPDIVTHGETGFLAGKDISADMVRDIESMVDRTRLLEISDKARDRFIENHQIASFRHQFVAIVDKALEGA